MKIIFGLNNKSKSPIKKKFLEEIITATIKEAGFDSLDGKNVEISMALVGRTEMRKINRTYRQEDRATDILSFPEYKNKKDISRDAGQSVFLGELILCYNDIASYARKEKKDLTEEIAVVVAHGALHLLGWEHGEEMFLLQKKITKKIV